MQGYPRTWAYDITIYFPYSKYFHVLCSYYFLFVPKKRKIRNIISKRYEGTSVRTRKCVTLIYVLYYEGEK